MTDAVLVLGAGGFVGRHAVTALRDAGLPVLAGVRRPDGAPPGSAPRRVDATDAASLAAALDGVSAVVNCVAGAPEAMVGAARTLCAAAGQRRIVHLSSMAVYGDATGLISEDAPLTPAGEYGEAKAEQERILQVHVAAGGDAVVLRPGCIHGPGSEQWTGRIARLLRAGRLGDLGADGDGTCNLSSIADVTAAILAALRTQGACGQAFNVSDPDPGDWNAYFLALARAVGAVPLRRLPGWRMKAEKLMAFPLKAAEVAGRKVRLRLPDPVPPSLLRLFQQDVVLDHRRADRVLNFPRTPPNRALADAAAWFLHGASGIQSPGTSLSI